MALALDQHVGAIIHADRVKDELPFVKLSQPRVLKVAVLWVLIDTQKLAFLQKVGLLSLEDLAGTSLSRQVLLKMRITAPSVGVSARLSA